MNIIDAWKAAKEGQKIESKKTWGGGFRKCGSLQSIIARGCDPSDASLLSDDWEVVKEKKTQTLLAHEDGAVVLCGNRGYQYQNVSVPAGAKVTIEWEE